MLLNEALKMVRDCPTDDAIAELLVSEQIVAIPTMASQCALARFFTRCDDVHSADVQDGDAYDGAELIYRSNLPDATWQSTDLGVPAYDFFRKFDHCVYPKLVPADLVEVYEMFGAEGFHSGVNITIRGDGIDHYLLNVYTKGYFENKEETHEAVRQADGSYDFTLIRTIYV